MQDIIINLGCISNAFPCIGFQGENEHRRIVFDAGEIYADYPDAVVTMVSFAQFERSNGAANIDDTLVLGAVSAYYRRVRWVLHCGALPYV